MDAAKARGVFNPRPRTLDQAVEAGYFRAEFTQIIGWDDDQATRLDHRATPEESDRAAGLIRVAERAKSVFGDTEEASRWLRKPKKAFDGKTCINMLATEYGGREVGNMLVLNVLINPPQPDMGKIAVISDTPFSFDCRLF
ncbi:antitoxin Xre/MbcA/ParS toxin-binding domain-containing protein [Skermanella stibiiresistens]|uniref:antitoxin Xre/MbcA/ParS toxin-binding domain-containing protein n=1 Tax=Skermanella stibiiresistens TaxID=913326 RepID=UPI0004B010D3|nr:antitoxin Xre/MbcA/ParS toxin-binding domain-containing protein [Skermanella stibiiresistens]